MKHTTLGFLFLVITITIGFSQNRKQAGFNLGFEKIKNGMPLVWRIPNNPDYVISLDSQIVHKGKYAVSIASKNDHAKFTAISFLLPHNYDGKKITLSGYIKTENVSTGYAGLWMRIDPEIAFDNMHNRGIKGTTGWEKYEITLKMDPSQTTQIVVGALLVGKGKMWLDQLKIAIDGKDITTLKPALAARDTTFDNGSKIKHINTDSATIENLRILGMVWGFLKYYHPNVAKGDYNWDNELFRVLPKILKTKAPAARDKIMVQWIHQLGDFQEEDEQPNFKDAKMKPDLNWLTSSNISPELSTLLVKIKNAKRSKKNYYVGRGRVGNPKFKHENPYYNMKFQDAGYRLLALYRYWNMIQYFYPDKYLIGQDWKKVLPEFIPKFIKDKNETDYTLTTLQLIAQIHDTHANIWGNNPALQKYFGLRSADPDLTFVDDKPVVAGFLDYDLKKEKLKKGDVITSVNGKKVTDIIRSNLKITPASNYPTQLRDLAVRLLRSNDSLITVTYLRNGNTKTTTLKTFPLNELEIAKKFQKSDTCFKMITPDIAYLYLGSIKSKYLPAIFKKIKKTKGLIIDLRCYPSDVVVFSLGKYLMPDKTEFVKFSHADFKYPGLFTIGKPIKVGQRNKNYYKGKVIILVNALTQSQAEYTTMAFRVAPNAMVIGSTTAGADGDISKFYLPGGIATAFSGLGIYYPNGDETQRVGIIPDIVVKPTIAGIKNGKDEVLEKAIEIINHPTQ